MTINTTDSAYIMPLYDGKVGMHKRADNDTLWFPGGAILPGKTAVSSAADAAWEQCGLMVNPSLLEFGGWYTLSTPEGATRAPEVRFYVLNFPVLPTSQPNPDLSKGLRFWDLSALHKKHQQGSSIARGQLRAYLEHASGRHHSGSLLKEPFVGSLEDIEWNV